MEPQYEDYPDYRKGKRKRRYVVPILGGLLLIVVLMLAIGLGLGFGMRKYLAAGSLEYNSQGNDLQGDASLTTLVPGPPRKRLGVDESTKDNSQKTTALPGPTVSGCKEFSEEELTARIESTHGEKWLKKTITSQDPPKCPPGFTRPPLLLISLDGFRPDYLTRNITPVLNKIQSNGIKTPYMRPSYPTTTFPNHYSIVTGLYPESSGIVQNVMWDSEIKKLFAFSGKTSSDPRWWHGEPIWVTAQKAGLKAATFFWPGSEFKIKGQYPDRCFPYNQTIPYEHRVDQVFSWLDLPEAERPDLIILYSNQPDTAGHAHGPNGDWVTGNLTVVDNMMGDIMDGLIDRGLDTCVDMIVVSDHGMTSIDCDRQFEIADNLMGEKYFASTGTLSLITGKYQFKEGKIIEIENGVSAEVIKSKLECRYYNTTKDFYSKVYLKGELPVRLHYARSPRIQDVIMTPTEGWLASVGRIKGFRCSGGGHGYDNIYTSMGGLFMAYGNSFNRREVEAFEGIEVYNLMSDVLGIEPVANNGTYGRLHHLLRHPPAAPLKMPPGSEYRQPVYPGEAERNQRRASSTCNCTTVDVEVGDARLNINSAEREESMRSHLSTGQPFIGATNLSVWKLVQEDFITAYSTSHKMALWSAFNLKPGANIGSRAAHCSRVDIRLPTSDVISCEEYNGGDVTASYLVPPGIVRNTDYVSDVTISTNIVPMFNNFREGTWQQVMLLIADYGRMYGQVNVMLGPVFDWNHDGLNDDVNNFTRFVPGSRVPLPTHYFVILTKCRDASLSIADCQGSEIDTMALLVPHTARPGHCWEQRDWPMEFLRTHVARVRDVELITGLIFYQGIATPNHQLRLRTHLEVGLWPRA